MTKPAKKEAKGIIALEELTKAISSARKASIQPKTVTSNIQADSMTSADPAGYIWTAGEQYYEIGLS